ncbi:integrase catalytic domain-containing protein [Trichonephila clavipes]|nr:integrase catalytic domain-containing protein [Trichonephila clavipes]
MFKKIRGSQRVVGVTSLTFEELSTLSSQIEACLKSRPLCVLSSSPDDLCVLTPGHFLIGKALTAIPQPTVPDNLCHCDRWRLLTRMTQHFWNRWIFRILDIAAVKIEMAHRSKEPLHRRSCLNQTRQLTPTTVEIRESHVTFPGKDSKVHVVKVKTQTSELVRPIAKLYPLPVNT